MTTKKVNPPAKRPEPSNEIAAGPDEPMPFDDALRVLLAAPPQPKSAKSRKTVPPSPQGGRPKSE